MFNFTFILDIGYIMYCNLCIVCYTYRKYRTTVSADIIEKDVRGFLGHIEVKSSITSSANVNGDDSTDVHDEL